jgi:hypothetical protein
MNTVSEGKPIFYDEDRLRWRRTRIVLEATGALFTLVLIVFFVSVIERVDLPAMLLPRSHSGLHAVLTPEKPKAAVATRRGRKKKVEALGQQPAPIPVAMQSPASGRLRAAMIRCARRFT